MMIINSSFFYEFIYEMCDYRYILENINIKAQRYENNKIKNIEQYQGF